MDKDEAAPYLVTWWEIAEIMTETNPYKKELPKNINEISRKIFEINVKYDTKIQASQQAFYQLKKAKQEEKDALIKEYSK